MEGELGFFSWFCAACPRECMVLLVATEGAFVSPGITVSAEEAAVLASDVPVATELPLRDMRIPS